jgi:hypothetical protein
MFCYKKKESRYSTHSCNTYSRHVLIIEKNKQFHGVPRHVLIIGEKKHVLHVQASPEKKSMLGHACSIYRKKINTFMDYLDMACCIFRKRQTRSWALTAKTRAHAMQNALQPTKKNHGGKDSNQQSHTSGRAGLATWAMHRCCEDSNHNPI